MCNSKNYYSSAWQETVTEYKRWFLDHRGVWECPLRKSDWGKRLFYEKKTHMKRQSHTINKKITLRSFFDVPKYHKFHDYMSFRLVWNLLLLLDLIMPTLFQNTWQYNWLLNNSLLREWPGSLFSCYWK